MKRINPMRFLLVSLTTLSCVTSSASSEIIHAGKLSGYSSYTKAYATDCIYTVERQVWDGRPVRKVFLNSDPNSMINYAIEIPEGNLPLQEGFYLQPFNNVEIWYTNGVLYMNATKSDQGYYGGHIIETIEIPVSNNLTTPRGTAKASSVYKSLTHPFGQTDMQLECTFESR